MADVAVAPLHLPGMITLKGDLGDPRLAMAVRGATGQGVPGRLAATFGPDGRGVLWMAPDEVLLIADGGGKMVASIALAMAGAPHLVADVSDARVAYRVAGPGARAVLARLSPADLAAPGFGPGSVRRTRLAQVPCAAWMTSDTGIDLLVSRSVAGYARAALEGAVASEVVTSVA
jgi:sarcosine oxidase, subunit gamma